MRWLLAILFVLGGRLIADDRVSVANIQGTADTAYFSKLTRAAWCEGQQIYQKHTIITSTESTNTFVLASPTAVGKTIHVIGYHVYSAAATISSAGLVEQRGRDSLTGVTVSTSAVYLPNASPSALPIADWDMDDRGIWGPCGWPLSVSALLYSNLTVAITAGNVVFHVVWFEE